MAVPKRKTSRTRRDHRRSQWKANTPNLSECPQCHQPKLPHRVCLSCGFYDGEKVLEVK